MSGTDGFDRLLARSGLTRADLRDQLGRLARRETPVSQELLQGPALDIVHAEPAQRIVDLGQDGLARLATAVWPLAHLAIDLGGEIATPSPSALRTCGQRPHGVRFSRGDLRRGQGWDRDEARGVARFPLQKHRHRQAQTVDQFAVHGGDNFEFFCGEFLTPLQAAQ